MSPAAPRSSSPPRGASARRPSRRRSWRRRSRDRSPATPIPIPRACSTSPASAPPRSGSPESSGVPGDTVQLALSGFDPNTQVAIAWDGAARLTVVTNAAGQAAAAFAIPASTKGTHLLSATSARHLAIGTFTVRPLVRPTPASGPVGQEVRVFLRGFAAREPIDLLWQNGSTTRLLTTVTASGSGTVNAAFRIPSAFGGNHTLTGDGGNGSLARATVAVLPTLTRSRTSAPPGEAVEIYLRGFQASESVAIALVDGNGSTPLTTTTTSASNGSRNVTVAVPAGALPGAATLTATGNRGTNASRDFTVLAPPAEAAVPSPTLTATATPAASPTTAPAETPTATPEWTPTAQATPTPEPTTTEPPVPTAAPTETPTEPAATATNVPAPAAAAPDAAPEAYRVRRARASRGAEPARLALDGDPTTAWSSPPGAAERPFIQIDLGEVVPLGAIRWLLAEDANPAGMEILVSTDRETWASLGSPDPGLPGAWQTLATGGIAARHVRVEFDGAAASPVGGLAEIELHP